MKALRWVDQYGEKIVLGGLLAVMSLATIAQVIMRYAFSNSLIWSEELSRFAFVWLVFIGTSYAAKVGSHLRLEVLNRMIPRRLSRGFEAIGDLVFGLLAVALVPASITLMQQYFSWGEISPAMHIPMWIVYAAVPVGLVLTALRCFQAAIERFRGKDLVVDEIQEA